jgi:hypothetical protein
LANLRANLTEDPQGQPMNGRSFVWRLTEMLMVHHGDSIPCILSGMNTPQRADPAIYPKMRENALKLRLNGLTEDSVHVVLMDWNVGNGTTSVLAAADGSASIYLSSGGGYLGGGQKYPAVRGAALEAVRCATALLSHFKKTESFPLPEADEVFFFLTTNSGSRIAIAKVDKLKDGSDALVALGAIMQKVITEYRLNSQR